MNYTIIGYGNSLSHHGTKGQKWGLLRWQNEDGTGTEAGLARRRAAYNAKAKEKNDKLRNYRDEGDEGLEKLKRDNAFNSNLDMYEKRWKENNPSPEQQEYDEIKKRNEQTNNVLNNANNLMNTMQRAGNQYYDASKYKISTSDVDVRSLSDEDLNRLNRRLEAEEKYKRLTTVEVADKGAERVREILQTVGTVVAIGTAGVALYNGVQEARAKKRLFR